MNLRSLYPRHRALEGIKDELCHIMEQSSVAEYKENEADMRAVCELAEDVRDAVMEHQVSWISPLPGGTIESAFSSLNRRRYTSRIAN